MIRPADIEAAVFLSRFGLGAAPPPPGLDPTFLGQPLTGAEMRAFMKAEVRAGVHLVTDLPDGVDLLLEMRAFTAASKTDKTVRSPAPERYRREVDRRLDLSPIGTGMPERLTAFWTNHFAVSVGKSQTMRILAGAYEREAIRPHVFGRFPDMLLAVVRHPAMLYFLDNTRSYGPNSKAGAKTGLNENLGREILELHTLGVRTGYEQSDVTALANMLTGWSVKMKSQKDQGGYFVFRAAAHEPGPQTLLGKVYDQKGVKQAEAALYDLAVHPATARHISTKLARHFISDTPPESLVERLTEVYLATEGDLSALTVALLDAPESATLEQKYLRLPSEFLAAIVRATALDLPGPRSERFLRRMGQPPWRPAGPDGYPDSLAAWATPVGLDMRLKAASELSRECDPALDPRQLAVDLFGPRLTPATAEAIALAESRPQGLAILFMSPEFLRR